MATNPENRTITISYPGGTVSGARGLLWYAFGPRETRWDPTSVPGSPRKRKYGFTQRRRAKPGRVHYLKLDDDKLYSVRVTGPTQKFVDTVLAKNSNMKVQAVYTQSGSTYTDQWNRLV